MTKYADGRYDHNAPGSGEPYVRPGYNSNEERLVGEAFAALRMPAELLKVATEPRNLFPPRFGYDRTEPGIRDVIEVDRRYPDSSAAFSGTSGSFTSSSTPSLGWW